MTQPIVIIGVKLGEGRPKTIISLLGALAEENVELIQKGIAVRILLVIIRHNLQVEQANHVDKDNDDSRHAYHIFSFLQRTILHSITTYEL